MILTEEQRKESEEVEKHKMLVFFLLWLVQTLAYVFLGSWDWTNPDDWYLCAIMIFIAAITSWYWGEPLAEMVRSEKKRWTKKEGVSQLKSFDHRTPTLTLTNRRTTNMNFRLSGISARAPIMNG